MEAGIDRAASWAKIRKDSMLLSRGAAPNPLRVAVRQYAFNQRQLREQVTLLSRELAEACYQEAPRDSRDVVVKAYTDSLTVC